MDSGKNSSAHTSKENHEPVATGEQANKKAATPRELKERIKHIRDLWAGSTTHSAKKSYDIGVEVRTVRNDKKKYGEGGVEIIAHELGVTASLLYAYAKVVKAWPSKKEFTSICEMTNTKGMPLTFTHFVVLAKVKNTARRAKLLTAACKRNWSSRDLEKHVVKGKTQRPATFTGVAKKAEGLLSKLQEQVEFVETVLASPEGLKAIEPEAFKKTMDDYKTILETATKLFGRFVKALSESAPATGQQAPAETQAAQPRTL